MINVPYVQRFRLTPTSVTVVQVFWRITDKCHSHKYEFTHYVTHNYCGKVHHSWVIVIIVLVSKKNQMVRFWNRWTFGILHCWIWFIDLSWNPTIGRFMKTVHVGSILGGNTACSSRSPQPMFQSEKYTWTVFGQYTVWSDDIFECQSITIIDAFRRGWCEPYTTVQLCTVVSLWRRCVFFLLAFL